jgi:predicted alpha/beta superfamily hydrolase
MGAIGVKEALMSGAIEVRVHYPAGRGRRIVLRSDRAWDDDLEPCETRPQEGRFAFRLPIAGTFSYFKPMLVEGGRRVWSRGDNHLALAGTAEGIDVWPHFLEDDTCSVCTRHDIPSRLQQQTHAVRVFLPPGYAENTLARYPVLYMQDGHNLFFPQESFGGEHWRIAETLRLLDTMSLTRRVIVVGIHPRERMEEYTAPGYEAYARFLCDELKPWVDATYRTRGGPADTSVMGSSLGGVVSLHLAWRRPDVFGAAACLSSTFGWRDDLFERVRSEPRRDIRIYLDSGWPGDNYEVTRAMRGALTERGYREGEDLLYFAFPEARHDERHWAMRAHIPMQFFHGRPDPGRAAGVP